MMGARRRTASRRVKRAIISMGGIPDVRFDDRAALPCGVVPRRSRLPQRPT
jgi:enoyl reductase-like protein